LSCQVCEAPRPIAESEPFRFRLSLMLPYSKIRLLRSRSVQSVQKILSFFYFGLARLVGMVYASYVVKESFMHTLATKFHAYRRFYEAWERGEIKRQPCKVCGEPFASAHHEDYTKPLEVTWLCRFHYNRLGR